MENQQAEPKGEEFPSYVADKRLIGLLPMFILVLIIVSRISWTLYKSFGDSSEDNSNEQKEAHDPENLSQMAFWYMIILVGMLLTWLFMFFCLRIIAMRQKTRSPQQRRMYVGSRARPSLAQQEPSIYVSPSNLPPPPKYECMAPPSYDEVVGVHYPNYQVQPITAPITTALAQTSSDSTETRSNDTGTAVTRTADETIVNVPRAVAASS